MTFPDLHLPQPQRKRGNPLRPAILAAIAIAALGFAATRIAIAPDVVDHHSMHDMAHMMASESSGAAGQPATTVTPISCQKLPNVPGKSLTLALVDFPPNGYTPRHRHPGSVAAFVIKGTLRSQLEGEPAETYTVGRSWFEPPGAIHLFAENASKTEPAQILATFIADDDCGPLTIPD
jgi:quercetin dioxygenase-like cupin family protein